MFMNGLAKRSLLGAAMLWLGVGQIESVRADPMAYVVAHNYSAATSDLFGEVDLTNGNFTEISALNTPGFTIFGMGFGSDGQIYGVGFNFTNQPSPGELFRINPTTGAATDLGALTYDAFAAAGSSNGTLYALDASFSSASLYSTNPLSNSSNLIGTVPFTADGLVAIDSHGNLFAAGNGDGSFYEVNTTNASSQLIGNTGLGDTLFAGTFVGSTLYGFEEIGANTGSTIVTIDTSNASITPGAGINLPSDFVVVAAAGAAAVPEPTSLVLGLIGGLGVLACGVLRRRPRAIGQGRD
jgi:hypothetical protein